MVNLAKSDEAPKIPERVHIASVGYEIDRIVLPFRQTKGERIHLIIRKDDDARGQKCLKAIKQELESDKKPYEIHAIDYDDLFNLIFHNRKIIGDELEKGNHVFVNISSGGNIQAAASHFASLTFKEGVTAYYAHPKTYPEKVDSERPQRSAGLEKIQTLPNYSIELPNNDHLKFMKIVAQSEHPSKKEIRDACVKSGLIAAKGKTAPYGHVVMENKYIRPLEERGLLRVEDKGRRGRVHLTDKGTNTLRLTGLLQ